MMSWIYMGCAVALPWLVIFLALRRIIPRVTRFAPPILGVSAFFLSFPASAFLGWLWLKTGVSTGVLMATLFGAVCFLTFGEIGHAKAIRLSQFGQYFREMDKGVALVMLVAVCALLSVIGWINYKFGFIAWDAWDVWMLRAKTWFLTGSKEIFVNYSTWAHAPLSDMYVSHHAMGKWAAISLATVWHAAALGQWDESILTLPWWLAEIAILCGIYEFLRQRRCRVELAMAGVLIGATLPFLSYHSILAGYGDIWVSGLLFCATCWLTQAMIDSDWRGAVLAMIFFPALIAVKVTAVLWVLTLSGCAGAYWLFVLHSSLSKRAFYVVGVGLLTLFAVTAALSSDLAVGMMAANSILFFKELLSVDNWSLIWWLFLMAEITAIWMGLRMDRDFLLTFGGASAILLTVIFSTGLLVGSHDLANTTNRIALQLVPVIVVGTLMTARDLGSLRAPIEG